MQAFNYSTPASVADARAVLASGGRLLAGGQSLLASMKLGLQAPEALADLSSLSDLRGITVAGGVVRIGAMTTHATVAASAEVRAAIPALADLAGHLHAEDARRGIGRAARGKGHDQADRAIGVGGLRHGGACGQGQQAQRGAGAAD